MVPKHPDPNNTNLCQDETRIVGRSFVENNLERMRNYHENVWYLPGWRYVMVDHPYSHKPDSAPCYRVWNEDIVDCDIGSAYVLCVTEMSGKQCHECMYVFMHVCVYRVCMYYVI